MQSWFKPAVIAIGLAFGASTAVWAADPVEDVFSQVSKGQYRQALTNVEKILEKNPKDLNARFMRGVILSELNRPEEAIEAFKSLTAEQPDLPEPYNNLAALYAQQRRYLDARESLERAVRINPAYTTALENLGDLYLRLAADVYAKARNLEDASPETARKLASVKNMISGAKDTQVADGTPPMVTNKRAESVEAAPAAAAPAPAPAPAAKVAIADPGERPGGVTRINKTKGKVAPARAAAAEEQAEPAAQAEDVPPLPETAEAPQRGARGTGDFDPAGVEEALRAWAGAWAKKDMKTYFASYARDFNTPKGGRAKWENQRRQRIQKPKSIAIELDDIDIQQVKDKAVVTFVQHYRSPLHRSNDTKTLVFAMRDGVWRIVEERASK